MLSKVNKDDVSRFFLEDDNTVKESSPFLEAFRDVIFITLVILLLLLLILGLVLVILFIEKSIL